MITNRRFLFTTGSAQITCYTVPSVGGEFNCLSTTDNFLADTIRECCVERNGYFFEGGGDESCQTCIGMERKLNSNSYLWGNCKGGEGGTTSCHFDSYYRP